MKTDKTASLEAGYRRYLAALTLFHQAAAELSGLSGTDYQASNLLDVDGPLTSGQLAHRLTISTGATTRLVDRLVAAGLAERVADPADRRRALVRSTGAMPDGLDALLARVRGPIEETLDALSPEQLRGVRDYVDSATVAYTEAARSLTDDGRHASPR